MENLYKIYNNVSLAESMITSLISKKGKVTKDQILAEVKISENAYDSIINKLLSSNVIKITDNEYLEYSTPLKGDVVVLDGDLLLPVSVINEGETKIVSRGDKWYRFSADFDLRRIVWNVNLKNLGNAGNRTLVDLLTTQVVAEKSRGIKHLSEYDHLVNKIVPYSDEVGLLINKVGEYFVDISIIHKIKISDGGDISQTIRTFRTHSEISTQELLLELNKDTEDRNFENIQLEHCVNIEDLIVSGNEIPISYAKDKYGTESSTMTDKLKYVRIKKMSKEIVYDICVRELGGNVSVIDTYTYESISEGIESIVALCKPFIDRLFRVNDFVLDI